MTRKHRFIFDPVKTQMHPDLENELASGYTEDSLLRTILHKYHCWTQIFSKRVSVANFWIIDAYACQVYKPQGANFWKTYVWQNSSTQVAYACNILEDVCLAICKQMYVWDKYYCCVAILKHVRMASTACHAYEITRKVRYR